ncbi:hypothetical protein ACJQWK_03132 [Exserohilum turcicum]
MRLVSYGCHSTHPTCANKHHAIAFRSVTRTPPAALLYQADLQGIRIREASDLGLQLLTSLTAHLLCSLCMFLVGNFKLSVLSLRLALSTQLIYCIALPTNKDIT